MTQQTETIKREVGERVDLMCSLDPTTVKDLGDGVFEATVTTPEKDRTGENIVTTGVDSSTWEKTGMPVLYGHDYSGLPIGKGLSFKSLKSKFTSRFQLAVEEYPFAATVAAMIKGGYLNAVSIGGIVKKWSEDYMTIVEMEMVEFSVVPIPANPSALITSRSLQEMTGKSVDQVREEYQDWTQKVLLDKLKGMPENEVKDAISVLKTLTARLEEAAVTPPLDDDNPQFHKKHFVLKEARAVAEQSHRVIRIVKLSKD
jgi:HK97 family phage prohead protease